MTNQEMLREIFPKTIFIYCKKDDKTTAIVCSDEWLNAEYKEPTTKNYLGVDAVSRQAVLELIADYDLSMGQVVKGIHALPSVTPQEPFINRPCVSSGVCEHDKNEVLDKIRAEIAEYGSIWVEYKITGNSNRDIEKLVSDVLSQAKKQVLDVIDKYRAETENT